MALPKKSDKVRKLVPLKEPYEELRSFRRELSELRLDFLLWNWNCISASICKEIRDKKKTESEYLQGNPMLWTVEHWAKVMGLEEEKRFPRERKILTAESNVGTEEEDNNRSQVPPQTTARGLVKVDVLPNRQKPERRLAKRRKVVTDDEEDLTLDCGEDSCPNHRHIRSSSWRVDTQLVVIEGHSSVLVEVPADGTVEPLKERTEMVSPNSLSSERTRSGGSEDVPQPKIGGEVMKEVTLSEAILEQIVAEVGGTVGNRVEEPGPPPPEEEVKMKTSGEEVKTLEITFPDFLQYSVVLLLKYLDVKREKYIVSKEAGLYVQLVRNRTKIKRAVAVKTKMARERAAILSAECGAAKAALKKQEDQLREKEIECKVLQLNLAKESGRAEEVRIAEELRGKIAEAKTVKEDLCSKIAVKADMRSQESRRRMEKIEEAYRHLQDETTDELRLRVEKCMRGFAMWGLQTMKWLKLDSLKRRLMSTKGSGSVGHKHIVEIVKTFFEGFDKAHQNVELEIVNVLRRLGAENSLDDAVTATSDGTAP
ncbi:hypothetical protein AXG93_4201s1350 [Marchantia polymorpha subsp. ruderalis]|uniref:Uncharacterized protein n=1 Tax=Marchantia polymorpha subsp. ruderalis TaxID=1480154 RepID=A0A176WBL7_MARPO|nr:hypothetical protein AXG93_4201s1350 [Marchantia polymorpha subsp. ruderalis]